MSEYVPAYSIGAVKHLTSKVPLNDLGLPQGYYRLDLLDMKSLTMSPINGGNGGNGSDPHIYDDKPLEGELQRVFTEKELTNAFILLDYSEGFPALQEGQPFWSCLEFEGPQFYEFFEIYLQLSGVRTLHLLPEAILIASGRKVPLEELLLYYHMYYWQHRARAYDLFRATEFRRRQIHRAVETQDEHFIFATQIMQKLQLLMGSQEDFWDLMTPKTAVDLLKQISLMQRLSSGLPGATPPVSPDGVGAVDGVSAESIFKVLAQKGTKDHNLESKASRVLELALQDPETAAEAQSLIVKLQTRGQESVQHE